MTFIHVVYSFQSRNQRYLQRKKIDFLIEKYKHNKNVQKLKHEVKELRKLRANQIQNENQNQKENTTEITTETFVTAEMDDKPDVQVRDSRTARPELASDFPVFLILRFHRPRILGSGNGKAR